MHLGPALDRKYGLPQYQPLPQNEYLTPMPESGCRSGFGLAFLGWIGPGALIYREATSYPLSSWDSFWLMESLAFTALLGFGCIASCSGGVGTTRGEKILTLVSVAGSITAIALYFFARE